MYGSAFRFFILIIGIICCIPSPIKCERILVIEPFPAKSHMTVFLALTRELASRGHEVLVISPFPLSKPMPNYTDINIMETVREHHEKITGEQLYEMGDLPVYFIPILLWDMGLLTTETVLRIPEVRAVLNDQRGFDLVIVEAFMNEAFYAFADHFKAPLILLAPFGGFHTNNYGHGNPIPLSYVPNSMLSYSDHMTLKERLINTIFTVLWDVGHQLYYLPRQEAIRKEIFGNGKNIVELERSVSLTMLNNHFSLNYPRPLVPSIIEVGGMHVTNKNEKLPVDIQTFLDGANEGAIFFSMGSNLRSDKMPIDKRDAFLAAFAELPQRVIWKWELEHLPGKTANIMTGKWLPQQDILAHKNVRLFITHGGLLSAQEAIYHGVPIVGIPVYGDQSLNMNKAEVAGYGLKLDMKNVTKESILWAVQKVLYDPRYQREVERRSAVYRDQPESPLDRAVFWTEYVLRHKGAPHLRSAAMHLSWYQLHMLDVLAVLILVHVVVFFALRALFRFVRGTKRSSTDTKDKNK